MHCNGGFVFKFMFWIHLVKVEHKIELTNIVKVFIQHLGGSTVE